MALRDYSSVDDYYEQGFGKDGVVSVWIGLKGDEDGDGDCDVLQDLCGVGYYNLDDQEINSFDFELVGLNKLLADISYAVSFADKVLAAAEARGIETARWLVVQYDFEYEPSRVKRKISADPVFLGTFPYSTTFP